MKHRKEPPKEGMMYREHGQWFACETLIERAKTVTDGQSVEIDWISPNGLEVSKVGTVVEYEHTDDWIDMRIRTGGPTDTCYLHINPDTGDAFFADDSRKVGDRELIQFNPY